jgi:hypothetical protein
VILTGRKSNAEFVTAFRDSNDIPDPLHFITRYQDQHALIESGYDVEVLRLAMKAFTSLQQVQILSIMDHHEMYLVDHIKESSFDGPWEYMDLRWDPACAHAVKTLGGALIDSKSHFSVFSGPMMSPQTALLLKQPQGRSLISTLASRLTCLELHFTEVEHRGMQRIASLDEKMRELSPIFKALFKAATDMRSIHLGFRQRLPLTLRLEEVFHGIVWPNLRIFGVQYWKLSSTEIINVCRRHRSTLRGLRLRNVLLTEGSSWRDVLQMLKKEMHSLDWISLRDIGYDTVNSFHSDLPPIGALDIQGQGPVPAMVVPLAIPNPQPPAGEDHTDSDDEAGEVIEDWWPSPHSSDDEDDDDEEDDDYDDEDDDAASHTAELHHPLESESDTPSHWQMGAGSSNTGANALQSGKAYGWCNCGVFPLNTPDMAEDEKLPWADEVGKKVPRWKRKIWECWVVSKCPVHASP